MRKLEAAITIVVCLTLFQSLPASAQSTTTEDIGSLRLDRLAVRWPSPEEVLRDLHSPDEQVRLKALELVGIAADAAYESRWSHETSSKMVGHALVMPSQSQLRFAAVGEDITEQAILSFAVPNGSMLYVAVAVHDSLGWRRIAAASCWCKYDMDPSRDALAEFVQLRPAPEPSPADTQHYELVLRTSSGGTGIYQQDEVHFRVRRDDLRTVLSFVSRRVNDTSAAGSSAVQIERRWFRSGPIADGTWGGVLIEGKGRYPADKLPEIEWQVGALQDRLIENVSCQSYRWNVQSFRYDPVKVPTRSCKVPGR